MTELLGRGAWNKKGVGGTLKTSKSNAILAGPYYLQHKNPNQAIGLRATLLLATNQPVELDFLATYHGVLGIQVLLSGFLNKSVKLDGIFWEETANATKEMQSKAGLLADGVIGQKTMIALLKPVIMSTGQDWKTVYAIIANESAFDPSAIGVLDTNDWGLAQINSTANPHVSFSDAMCPSYAVKYVANRLNSALFQLGNIDDAIASYNLGIGGTRSWVKDGRPAVWTPSYATTSRNVQAYIDRIKNLAMAVSS